MEQPIPDPLSERLITDGLHVRTVGQRVIYEPVLDSTMDAAREAVKSGCPEGTVVITGYQTRGRGRLDRSWQTPAGNIAVSIVLFPEAAALPYLIMMASLATARGIEAATGLKTDLKWPNDVLIKGRKVCGILIENELRPDKTATAIVGIGINTAVDPAALGDVITPATSLSKETGATVSRPQVIRKLLEAFDEVYDPAGDRHAVYEAWRDRLITLGQRVTVNWKDTVWEATAESVDESGALLVRKDDGTLTAVVAGDVSLRPASA